MIQVVLLGPVKQPYYCKGQDWNDRPTEHNYLGSSNYIKFYHVVYGGSYHTGDQLTLDSYELEVYGAYRFDDKSFMNEYISEILLEEYPDIKEI